MIPSHRAPTSPGEILLLEFLEPLKMTQVELARRMGVPLQRVNLLINGKRAITADTALLLARVFKTSPEMWMALQASFDLWQAQHRSSRRRTRHAA
jgi:addiction module HigA family antidote